MAVKQITFRVEPEEYEELEAQWRRAGFESLQAAGLHAFRTAFEEEGPEGVPARYRHYSKMLAEVLGSEDEDLIELVVKPLEFARRRIRTRASRPPKDGR